MFGVSLIFETPFTVKVKVSGEHFENTAGLCGTCNGISDDDFFIEAGIFVSVLNRLLKRKVHYEYSLCTLNHLLRINKIKQHSKNFISIRFDVS